jgi:GTPase SAR1 family protein
MKSLKLIIAGLDYAGKTSSIIALREKYNFYEKVENLKPTVKVEYSSFEFLDEWEVNIWDMGGQEKYRELYLDKHEYFADTNYFYYYIDIQDEEKLLASINYLNELLGILKNTGYSNKIIICFHKYDPKLRRDKDILDRIRNVKAQIEENEGFDFKFFRTSIFDISSLSKAVSYSLNTLIDFSVLRMVLKGLIRKFNGNYAILYTDSGVILVDYYKEVLDSIEYEEKVRQNINRDLILIQKLNDDNVEFSERVDYDEQIKYLKKYEIGSNTFFLKMNTPKLNDDEIKLLKKNFQNFEQDLKDAFLKKN